MLPKTTQGPSIFRAIFFCCLFIYFNPVFSFSHTYGIAGVCVRHTNKRQTLKGCANNARTKQKGLVIFRWNRINMGHIHIFQTCSNVACPFNFGIAADLHDIFLMSALDVTVKINLAQQSWHADVFLDGLTNFQIQWNLRRTHLVQCTPNWF